MCDGFYLVRLSRIQTKGNRVCSHRQQIWCTLQNRDSCCSRMDGNPNQAKLSASSLLSRLFYLHLYDELIPSPKSIPFHILRLPNEPHIRRKRH